LPGAVPGAKDVRSAVSSRGGDAAGSATATLAFMDDLFADALRDEAALREIFSPPSGPAGRGRGCRRQAAAMCSATCAWKLAMARSRTSPPGVSQRARLKTSTSIGPR
jgi:hypothetical protein